MSVLDFDPHISVDDIINVKNPDYSIRAIELENLRKTIETPIKIISGDDVDKTSFNRYSSHIPNAIFESARSVQSSAGWISLEKYLTELPGTKRNNKLRNFFKINRKLWDNSLTTLSLTFPRNPFEKHEFLNKTFGGFDEDSYIFLLNFICNYSAQTKIRPKYSIFSVNTKN